jgi:hypothetical protein
VSAATGAVVSLPFTALDPDQPPDAVHDVRPVLFHDSDDVPFAGTERGAADSVSDTAIGCTVTETLRDTEPPAPVHANV